MNVEEIINRERERIIKLEINESSKENMLKAFDETVSLYKGTIAKAVAEAFGYTAYYTNSEEAVIETTKILAGYHNQKEAEEVAEAIAKTARSTKSKEMIKEVAETLKLYHNRKDVKKIVREIGEVVSCYQINGKTTKDILKKLKDTKEIYNLDSRLFIIYIINISNNLSKNIKYSLSFKDINKITDTYSLTMDFCKDEGSKFQDKVKKGFFYHLNKAIDKGKTIDDKLKIMNKWSDNVYTTFKDHPEYFMEFIR